MLLKYYQKIKVFAGTRQKSLFICGILLFLLLPIYDKYLWIENDPFDFGHIVALEKYDNIAHNGTVYKSRLYDLIIPFPSYESGAEREKRRAVVFASGKTGKSE